MRAVVALHYWNLNVQVWGTERPPAQDENHTFVAELGERRLREREIVASIGLRLRMWMCSVCLAKTRRYRLGRVVGFPVPEVGSGIGL